VGCKATVLSIGILRIEVDTIVTTYSIALIDKELTLGSKGVDVMTFVDRQDNRPRKEYSTRTRSPVRFAAKEVDYSF